MQKLRDKVMFSKKVQLHTALLIVYVLNSGGIILLAQESKMREVGRRDWSNSMPDGEGKGLILGACAQCHSLNSTVQQRKPRSMGANSFRHDHPRSASSPR